MADSGVEDKGKKVSRPYPARSKCGRQDKNAVQTFCFTFPATPSARGRRAIPSLAMNEWWPTPNGMTLGDGFGSS
jgi:hypothetical protein